MIKLLVGRLRGLTGSALDHISLPPEFESRRGHIWGVFHLWFRFITFGDRSAHLTYHVHTNHHHHHHHQTSGISSSVCWHLTVTFCLLAQFVFISQWLACKYFSLAKGWQGAWKYLSDENKCQNIGRLVKKNSAHVSFCILVANGWQYMVVCLLWTWRIQYKKINMKKNKRIFTK